MDHATSTMNARPSPHSPLEAFLRDYAEVTGGLWDEVEPQVYDLMLPAPDRRGRAGGGARGLRPRGDPRASRGAARQLRHAAGRPPAGRRRGAGPARRALPGRPEPRAAGPGGPAAPGGDAAAGAGAAGRAGAAAALPPGRLLVRGDVRERPEGAGPPAGGDRPALRPAGAAPRPACSIAPTWPRSPGRRCPRRGTAASTAAYPIARDRVVRTLAALANTRGPRADRAARPPGRADGAATTATSAPRSTSRPSAPAPEARTTAPSSPPAARRSTARSSSASPSSARRASLKVHLRLINLLVIHQPKLLLQATVTRPAVPRRPPRAGLGPAGRGPRSRRLPELRPADLRPGPHPARPPRLPRLPDPVRDRRRSSGCQRPTPCGSGEWSHSGRPRVDREHHQDQTGHPLRGVKGIHHPTESGRRLLMLPRFLV